MMNNKAGLLILNKAADSDSLRTIEVFSREIGKWFTVTGMASYPSAKQMLVDLTKVLRANDAAIILADTRSFYPAKLSLCRALGIRMVGSDDVKAALPASYFPKTKDEYELVSSFPAGARVFPTANGLLSGFYVTAGKKSICFLPLDAARLSAMLSGPFGKHMENLFEPMMVEDILPEQKEPEEAVSETGTETAPEELHKITLGPVNAEPAAAEKPAENAAAVTAPVKQASDIIPSIVDSYFGEEPLEVDSDEFFADDEPQAEKPEQEKSAEPEAQPEEAAEEMPAEEIEEAPAEEPEAQPEEAAEEIPAEEIEEAPAEEPEEEITEAPEEAPAEETAEESEEIAEEPAEETEEEPAEETEEEPAEETEEELAEETEEELEEEAEEITELPEEEAEEVPMLPGEDYSDNGAEDEDHEFTIRTPVTLKEPVKVRREAFTEEIDDSESFFDDEPYREDEEEQEGDSDFRITDPAEMKKEENADEDAEPDDIGSLTAKAVSVLSSNGKRAAICDIGAVDIIRKTFRECPGSVKAVVFDAKKAPDWAEGGFNEYFAACLEDTLDRYSAAVSGAISPLYNEEDGSGIFMFYGTADNSGADIVKVSGENANEVIGDCLAGMLSAIASRGKAEEQPEEAENAEPEKIERSSLLPIATVIMLIIAVAASFVLGWYFGTGKYNTAPAFMNSSAVIDRLLTPANNLILK